MTLPIQTRLDKNKSVKKIAEAKAEENTAAAELEAESQLSGHENISAQLSEDDQAPGNNAFYKIMQISVDINNKFELFIIYLLLYRDELRK